MAERRKEKERENLRLRESSMRAEEALTAKERIYRERIHGLEQQIETLRDQLSKEMKRRQLLISGMMTTPVKRMAFLKACVAHVFSITVLYTICFFDSWPQTKCRVTSDSCF